jgi:hypothetical protein
MKGILLLVTLLAQVDSSPIPSIELEKKSMYNIPNNHIVTVVGKFSDGRPAAKAKVYCDGGWYRHSDWRENRNFGDQLGFRTDSRGAAIFNPLATDEQLVCHVEKDGKKGTGELWFSGTGMREIMEITLK